MPNNSDLTPPAELIGALMNNPVKRALLLQLLNQEKDGFETYKRRNRKDLKNDTPLKKVSKVHCESPTALQRRRALEKLNQDSTSESSSSEQSENIQIKGPQLPFEQLLKGVKAYVEVKRDDKDRSEGIKAVMKLMGATIKDEFTNDVTHVVFKDGSFTTYQKAKLMNVHLVSVLWLDAVRRNNARVPEKNYPAFGSNVCDENVSRLCSQLQKDYEDIIKDEKRRSMSQLSKSVKTHDRNRRRTMMTPQSSLSSYLTAQKSSSHLLFSDVDQEIDKILSGTKSNSSELTSDDSDCGIIDGHASKRNDKSDLFQMSVDASIQIPESNRIEDTTSSSTLESQSSKSLLNRVSSKNVRKTINVISDMLLTPNVETTKKSDEGTKKHPKKVLQNSSLQSSTMSSLRISSTSERTKSGLDDLKDTDESAKTKASEVNDKENCSVKTDMSPLKLSDSSKIVSSRRKPISSGISTPRRQSRRSLFASSQSSSDNFNKTESASTRKAKVKSSVRSSKSGSEDNSLNNSSCDIDDYFEIKNSKKNKNVSPLSASKSESENRRSKSKTPRKSPTQLISSSVKKTKRLYNPNDFIGLSPPENEKEREEYLKNKSKKNDDSVFVNPNNVLIASLQVNTRSRSSNRENVDSIDDIELKEQKKKKKDQKNNKTPPVRDSTADEQKDLLDLLTNKLGEAIQIRRSQRISLSQTKPKYRFASSFSESETTSSLPISPVKRRSTMDFQNISHSQKRKLKIDRKKTSSIVCTKMHRNEVRNFEQIVNKLGEYFVENQVSDKTTHLVVGESKRTINMLRALARGCWILEHEWLLKSMEAGKWLLEEDFEVVDFSPAVQECRLQRQAFGPKYTMDIFKDCGCIYIGKSTTPKPSDLKELITICKGTVTMVYRNAAIIVGEYVRSEGVVCVTEMWVLDSITFNKLKSFKNYLIKPIAVDSPHY